LSAGIQPATVVDTTLCPSCGAELVGTYCHRCGEKVFHEKDLALTHFLQHGLHDLTHLDSKIFATLRYLFTRPGFLTSEYLAGRRLHYVKPLSLFLVACAVFFLADSIRPIDPYNLHRLTQSDNAGKINAGWERIAALRHASKEVVAVQIEVTIHKLATTAQLANILALAVVLALFYRRPYFTLHLVFACHFFVFYLLTLILLSPLASAAGHLKIRPLWVLLTQSGVFVGYLFFAMRRVYAQGVATTLLKAIITYAMTQLVTFGTFVIMLTVAVVFAAMS
jgi:hypothetical protein